MRQLRGRIWSTVESVSDHADERHARASADQRRSDHDRRRGSGRTPDPRLRDRSRAVAGQRCMPGPRPYRPHEADAAGDAAVIRGVLNTPAACLMARGEERLLLLEEVEALLVSRALVVDACRQAECPVWGWSLRGSECLAWALPRRWHAHGRRTGFHPKRASAFDRSRPIAELRPGGTNAEVPLRLVSPRW